MKLRTLVPVSYNKKGTIRGRASGLVEMTLGTVAYGVGFTSIGVNYTYTTVEVKADPSKGIEAVAAEEITTSAFHINSAAEINGLFGLIQPNLPAFENEVQYTLAKFLEGAKYQMAQTFEISPEQIEIVE